MDENVVDVDVKDSDSLCEKLLKDKESFTYKLRRQLNSLGELRYENMSSSSVEKYEKIVLYSLSNEKSSHKHHN